MRRHFRHAALMFGAACSFGDGPSPTLAFRDDGRVDVVPFRASGRALDDVLAVFVNDTTSLPVIGTRVLVGDTLRFTPRFSASPATNYVARFRPHGGTSGMLLVEWRSAPPGAPTTIVRAIYPTVDTVPMNLLRMYVEFSAPMSTGRAWEYIKVYAEPDSLLSEPFFTGGDAIELWDPDKTRLTILFDPGRIKSDLKPREERGLPIRQGKRYRLVVDSAWPDSHGRPLAAGHVKRFLVGPMDRSVVMPAEWRVVAPRANTRDSLLLRFPESLDRALLQRLIVVRDSAGAAVNGEISIGPGERRWWFTPHGVWGHSRYHVEVDTELEDLAGNNVRKLFDVTLGDSSSGAPSGRTVQIGFVPRAQVNR
jgi:hypothetical protein